MGELHDPGEYINYNADEQLTEEDNYNEED